MKLRHITLLSCAFCLASAAAGQSQPSVPWASPPTLKSPCPDTVDSKTAWFDPSLYLIQREGITFARPLSVPDPDYSESARKHKIQGTVVLAMAINAGGTVDAVKVVCSLEPGLDANAVAAARTWKFAPASKDAHPVPVQTELSVAFRMY